MATHIVLRLRRRDRLLPSLSFVLIKGVKTLEAKEQLSVGFDLEAPHWPDKGPSSSSCLTPLTL